MKILNLYAGIGGNRKLWGDEHEITAVEHNEEIAGIYKDYFPNDNVVIGDAHQFLLDHYKDFDFIWSSPPCQSHSRIRNVNVHMQRTNAIYPDMKLWQEIIFLQQYCKNQLYIVENVKPYYKVFLPESFTMQRHLFWNNFFVNTSAEIADNRDKSLHWVTVSQYGFDISKYKINHRKQQIIRNLVNPELGLYILEQAIGQTRKLDLQNTLFSEAV